MTTTDDPRLPLRNTRRGFILEVAAAAAAGLAAPSALAQAGAWPQRPIKFIVPNAPGSSVDTIGRIVANEMGQLLHQAAVVDNRAGAAGALGVEIGRTSPPDGYTLILGSSSSITAAPLLQKAVTYDALRDLEMVSLAAVLPNVLVCNMALPVRTPVELAAYCRSKGNTTNMASAGIGSISHLAGVAFQSAAGFQSLHVPYKGGTQGVTSVMAGETDWEMTPAPAVMSLVAQGKLRLLGHSMAPTTQPLGDVPAIGKTVPGFEFASWIGLLAPKGLPPQVIAALNKALAQALKSPDVRKAFDANGAVPTASTPQEFRAYLTRDTEVNKKAIQVAGIQAE